ncbi:MAG: ribosome biogenesis GTP-binding protein YihA/YsxC [Candidatus Sericytochromatia bacterium]|nr:ribosome biogenesis GTP-binding protein YihA/YsxC [Candidatus Sericytochromatia bacterium]
MFKPQARFITTAMDLASCPTFSCHEFAVVGRSNVGKSSLINALAQQKALARISKTPGRTQGINYFDFGPFLIADLPGYGYAAVSKAMQERWRRELSRYLAGRESLAGVLHLMDSRHPLQPNDLQMRAFLMEHEVPLVVVLTKIDELKQADLARTAKRVAEETSQDPILFSSRTGRGRKELLKLLVAGPAAEETSLEGDDADPEEAPLDGADLDAPAD